MSWKTVGNGHSEKGSGGRFVVLEWLRDFRVYHMKLGLEGPV